MGWIIKARGDPTFSESQNILEEGYHKVFFVEFVPSGGHLPLSCCMSYIKIIQIEIPKKSNPNKREKTGRL